MTDNGLTRSKHPVGVRHAETLAWKINLLLDTVMTETGKPFDSSAVLAGARTAGYELSYTRWLNLKNGKVQTIPKEALLAVARTFDVDPEFLLHWDGPLPAKVKSKLPLVKKNRRNEVREFAAKVLGPVDPEVSELISLVLSGGALISERADNVVVRTRGLCASGTEAARRPLELDGFSGCGSEDPNGNVLCGNEMGPAKSDWGEGGHRWLMFLAAQLLSCPVESDGALAGRMSKVLPWMLSLSPTDQDACANEVLSALRESLASGQPRRAHTSFVLWREKAVTAAAHVGKKDMNPDGTAGRNST